MHFAEQVRFPPAESTKKRRKKAIWKWWTRECCEDAALRLRIHKYCEITTSFTGCPQAQDVRIQIIPNNTMTISLSQQPRFKLEPLVLVT
jgi:hypothetical protein